MAGCIYAGKMLSRGYAFQTSFSPMLASDALQEAKETCEPEVPLKLNIFITVILAPTVVPLPPGHEGAVDSGIYNLVCRIFL